MKPAAVFAPAFAAMVMAGPALAQTEPPKLAEIGSAAAATFTPVGQGGQTADDIRRTLDRINLPEGFRISLYAVVPNARHMAVGPQGKVVIVGTRRDKVWSVADANGDGTADEVKDFAPGIAFTMPNGPCFSPDGFLYLAEQNRVLVFPGAEYLFEKPDIAAFAVVPEGELVPPAEQSGGHSARTCQIGPDGKLYITLGQPYNVSPKDKLALYDALGIGGIIRLNTDGTGREVYTRGLRNSVGMDFNPANGELWFTDNQVDRMGDDIPPGELNRQTAAGQHFGFPWFGGGAVRTNEYKGEEPPAGVIFPAVEMVAHAADLGMTFYTGRQFPAQYRGGIFSAQHGSWNRSTPVGARVMFTPVNPDGSAGETVVFADGWLSPGGGYLGRPVDVAQLPDGSLLVSDDKAGALYRISYGK